MSGGGGSGNTKTTTEPWSGQKPYLEQQYKNYANQYQNYAPQYFPESTVAGISPYTSGATAQLANFGNSPYYQQGAVAGRQAVDTFSRAQSAYTNPVTALGMGNAAGVNNYLSSTLSGQNAVDPNAASAGSVYGNYQQMVGQMTQNPQLDAMVNAAQTRTAQNFNEQVMPQISTNALANNAYGGSRQGIAEGLAADRLQQQMGDIATGMYGQAYESGQNRALQGGSTQAGLNTNVNLANSAQDLQGQLANQQLQQYAVGQAGNFLTTGTGMGLDAARLQQGTLPSYAAYGQIPTQNLLQAGQIDQSYRQSLLDDEIQRWNWSQNLPYNSLDRYAAGIQGNVGNTTQSSGANTSTSPITGAVGGLAAGAGIAGAAGLFPTAATATAAAAAASPWLWPVLLGGAALGYAGNR
jgi:hypothetical protein